MRYRKKAIADIKAALKARSRKEWSVTGGRGTAYSYITISSPPRRRIDGITMTEADRETVGLDFSCKSPMFATRGRSCSRRRHGATNHLSAQSTGLLSVWRTKVREPEQRIGNRRLFSSEDALRLAHHFKVVPDWSATEMVPAAPEAQEQAGLALRPPYQVTTAGGYCCEVRDSDGEAFGWTGDLGTHWSWLGLWRLPLKADPQGIKRVQKW
jgi:hypothetical protein